MNLTDLKRRNKYVSGGIHLTNPALLPLAILKEVTATERFKTIHSLKLPGLTLEDLDYQQKRIYDLSDQPEWEQKTDPLSSVEDVQPYVPWFLKCNPDRFPYWYGKPDPRNYDMLNFISN